MKTCKECGWPVFENSGQEICVGDWVRGLAGQVVVDCILPLSGDQEASALVMASGNLLPVREVWWSELVSKVVPSDWVGLCLEGAMLVAGNVYYAFTGEGGRKATAWAKLTEVEDECSWYLEDQTAC